MKHGAINFTLTQRPGHVSSRCVSASEFAGSEVDERSHQTLLKIEVMAITDSTLLE